MVIILFFFHYLLVPFFSCLFFSSSSALLPLCVSSVSILRLHSFLVSAVHSTISATRRVTLYLLSNWI